MSRSPCGGVLPPLPSRMRSFYMPARDDSSPFAVSRTLPPLLKSHRGIEDALLRYRRCRFGRAKGESIAR